MISRSDREALDELLRRSRDPHVHARVWDHIEGKISKAELYRDRLVARELSAWYAEVFRAARDEGFDPAEVARDVREEREQRQERDGRPPMRWEDRHELAAELREEIARLKG